MKICFAYEGLQYPGDDILVDARECKGVDFVILSMLFGRKRISILNKRCWRVRTKDRCPVYAYLLFFETSSSLGSGMGRKEVERGSESCDPRRHLIPWRERVYLPLPRQQLTWLGADTAEKLLQTVRPSCWVGKPEDRHTILSAYTLLICKAQH
jgi:hypothetical protein